MLSSRPLQPRQNWAAAAPHRSTLARFCSQRWLTRPFGSSLLHRFHCNGTWNGPFGLISSELGVGWGGGGYIKCVCRGPFVNPHIHKRKGRKYGTHQIETILLGTFLFSVTPSFRSNSTISSPHPSPTPCFIFFIFPDSAPSLNLREDIRSGCLWKTQHLQWNCFFFFSCRETDGSLRVSDRSCVDCFCRTDKHERTHTCTHRGREDKRDCLCWGWINFYEFWIAVYGKIHF